jgi:heptosyltransferase III
LRVVFVLHYVYDLSMSEKNILFIAPTRIGDAVLATSMLRHLLTTEPTARVTIITSPLSAPLFEGYPNLAHIITVTKQTYNRHWLKLWRETFGTRWHALWDMRNSILSYTLRSTSRHTFRKTKHVAPKVKQYESVFGIPALPYPTLWPRNEDTSLAANLLPPSSRYLIFAPIANWAPKEWPLHHFIEVAKLLLSGTCAGYRPIIICASHEREKAAPMLEALAEFSPIDLTQGNTHLLSVFACMQRAHGFIGNDSGLMHMAAAASIPTLGLFGPTPHEIYQPWGERAGYLRAPNDDLSLLKPLDVAEKFQQLLAQ